MSTFTNLSPGDRTSLVVSPPVLAGFGRRTSVSLLLARILPFVSSVRCLKVLALSIRSVSGWVSARTSCLMTSPSTIRLSRPANLPPHLRPPETSLSSPRSPLLTRRGINLFERSLSTLLLIPSISGSCSGIRIPLLLAKGLELIIDDVYV
ncbi:MAG: hypothetical protein [Circoviridae sp.]|nr:MAG: hypothetical protein [Circoviridae sp.]